MSFSHVPPPHRVRSILRQHTLMKSEVLMGVPLTHVRCILEALSPVPFHLRMRFFYIILHDNPHPLAQFLLPSPLRLVPSRDGPISAVSSTFQSSDFRPNFRETMTFFFFPTPSHAVSTLRRTPHP